MIHAKYGIETPSVGAILREEQAAKTPRGLQVAEYTNAGRLVPDEIIVELVKVWLDAHDGAFVFDGFPRTVGQAAALELMLNKRNTPLQIAISLDVDVSTIEGRVSRRMVCAKCGLIVSVGLHVASENSPCPRCGGELRRRKDDSIEALQRRLIEYREKSEPLISFYSERGILTRIVAHDPPESVFAEVDMALNA